MNVSVCVCVFFFIYSPVACGFTGASLFDAAVWMWSSGAVMSRDEELNSMRLLMWTSSGTINIPGRKGFGPKV